MIGVFDSGLGGLCALRHLRKMLPDADLLYYADTAHLPFGTRTEREICAYTRRALTLFRSCGADAVLIACGTASSLVPGKCKAEFPFPVFDVLHPAACAAAATSPFGRIAVAATVATCASGAFAREIRLRRPEVSVLSLPCPALVLTAEEGVTGEERRCAVREALDPVCAFRADTLVLGCTHFPLLRATIEALYPYLRIVDAAEEGARRLAVTVSPPHESGRVRYLVTGSPDRFAERAHRALGGLFAEGEIYPC